MRFSIVTTQKHFGGGEVLVASIADALLTLGHEVSWVVRKNSAVQEQLQQRKQRIGAAIRGRGRNPADLLAVRKLIREENPDVVLMNDTHAVMLAGVASMGLGTLRPTRLAYKHTVFPLRSKFKYRMLTDRVVCVSQAAKQVVVHGGLESEKVAVIYGGVKPPKSNVEFQSSQLRREFGVTDNQSLLVSVGSLLDCKGHSDLLRSLSGGQFDSDVRLLIAGEGPERSSLEAEIKKLGLSDRVTLLGHREDAMSLLQAADLVVHPSHAEGLSLVLIQAQMLRKPIVATAVGGAAEVLQCDSPSPKSTWIAPAGDPAGLAEQVRRALNTVREPDAKAMLQKNLELVAQRSKQKFDVHSAARALVELAGEIRGVTVPRNAA